MLTAFQEIMHSNDIFRNKYLRWILKVNIAAAAKCQFQRHKIDKKLISCATQDKKLF